MRQFYAFSYGLGNFNTLTVYLFDNRWNYLLCMFVFCFVVSFLSVDLVNINSVVFFSQNFHITKFLWITRFHLIQCSALNFFTCSSSVPGNRRRFWVLEDLCHLWVFQVFCFFKSILDSLFVVCVLKVY